MNAGTELWAERGRRWTRQPVGQQKGTMHRRGSHEIRDFAHCGRRWHGRRTRLLLLACRLWPIAGQIGFLVAYGGVGVKEVVSLWSVLFATIAIKCVGLPSQDVRCRPNAQVLHIRGTP